MSKRRVLVTGASGVFGRDIATRLSRGGADVVALARREVSIPGVEFVAGDIRDPAIVEQAMKGCDAVAHLAWAVAPLKEAGDTHAVNLGGTENVLDAMDATGCRRIVFSSSVTAYGSWPDNPPLLQETDPLRPDPKVLYAWDKARCEELIGSTGRRRRHHPLVHRAEPPHRQLRLPDLRHAGADGTEGGDAPLAVHPPGRRRAVPRGSRPVGSDRDRERRM